MVQVTKVLGAPCGWCGENTGREGGSTHESRVKHTRLRLVLALACCFIVMKNPIHSKCQSTGQVNSLGRMI